MKIGMHAFQMAQDWDLDETIRNLTDAGMASFEFFVNPRYKQRVDIDTPKAERAEVKKKFEDAGLVIPALSIECRYHFMDPAEVRQNIDLTKQYIELAKDIGAPRLRCLGDKLQEDKEPKEVTFDRVAAALRELCEYGDEWDIDCPIEMHGDFSSWENALAIVERVDHPRNYLIHNGQPRNTPPEQFDEVFDKLRPYLHHVHVHDILADRFPHRKFFKKLAETGYDGYVSLEQKPSDDPVRVMQLSRALIEEWTRP